MKTHPPSLPAASRNAIHRRDGFTLVELLVVLAITGLLLGIAIPVFANVRMSVNRAKCASNMRQIGLAMLGYAGDHNGLLPPTTHTTGGLGKAGRTQSWIYQLSPWLGDVDEVRICPADNAARQKAIRETQGPDGLDNGLTSYVLNDIIFDPEDDNHAYNRLQSIPHPPRTMMMFPASDDLPVNRGWDHAHCGGWTSWWAILGNIEPDRHRPGDRAPDRLKGSANYLFMDAHVENIEAADLKKRADAGVNPGAVPP